MRLYRPSLIALWIAVLSASSYGTADAAAPDSVDSDTPVVFADATVITMDGDDVLGGHSVLVEGGLIAEVAPADELVVPEGAVVIDATGRFLMPGLSDMHTHLGAEVSAKLGVGAKQLTVYLANGVTTILNLGDFETRFGRNLDQMKEGLRDGSLIGPTMYTASYARGEGDTGQDWQILRDAQDGVDHVERAVESGYDYIKVYNRTPRDAFDAIIRETRERDMAVIGHIPGPVGTSRALNGGLSMVAHAEAYFWTHFGFQPDADRIAEAVSLTANNQVWVNSTLYLLETASGFFGGDFDAFRRFIAQPRMRYAHPEEILVWKRGAVGDRWNPSGSSPGDWDERFRFVKEYTRRFHDAGIRLVLGTDSPTVLGVPGFSTHEEMRVLKTLGLTNREVLETATLNPGLYVAETLPGAEPFGQVTEGMRADLLLLEADPLADIGNAAERVGVMARGRWYSEANLQARIETIAEEYDGFRDTTLGRVQFPDETSSSGSQAGSGSSDSSGSGGGGRAGWLGLLAVVLVLAARRRRVRAGA